MLRVGAKWLLVSNLWITWDCAKWNSTMVLCWQPWSASHSTSFWSWPYNVGQSQQYSSTFCGWSVHWRGWAKRVARRRYLPCLWFQRGDWIAQKSLWDRLAEYRKPLEEYWGYSRYHWSAKALPSFVAYTTDHIRLVPTIHRIGKYEPNVLLKGSLMTTLFLYREKHSKRSDKRTERGCQLSSTCSLPVIEISDHSSQPVTTLTHFVVTYFAPNVLFLLLFLTQCHWIWGLQFDVCQKSRPNLWPDTHLYAEHSGDVSAELLGNRE